MNPNPQPRVDTNDMPDYNYMLVELATVGHDFSQWETDFIESLFAWHGDFTEKQATTLKHIHERRV